MSDVYNIKLDLRSVSEADIRRNLKWLLSIGFMTFLLSYKYSMYPENAVFFFKDFANVQKFNNCKKK